MSLFETAGNADAGVNAKGKRFSFKPRDLISLMRQVAADNPFQYDSSSEQLKAWETITTELQKVGITAFTRSLQVKCTKLLDDFDKGLKRPLKSGTEPKVCDEMNQLLQDVSEKRKEEKERHLESAKAKKVSVPVKKSKERVISDVQAGKEIREASMITMKRSRGKRHMYPDKLAHVASISCSTVRHCYGDLVSSLIISPDQLAH